MPISREEFARGRIDLMVPIAHLLEDYPDLAFTADEVQQMLIETRARNPSLEEVEQGLDALASQQAGANGGDRRNTKEYDGIL